MSKLITLFLIVFTVISVVDARPRVARPRTASTSTVHPGHQNTQFGTASSRPHTRQVPAAEAKRLQEQAMYKYRLGSSLFQQGRYDDAISAMKGVVSDVKTPTELRAVCAYNIAGCYIKLKKWSDVVRYLKITLKFKPDMNQARLMLIRAHVQLQNYDMAALELKTGLEKLPNDPTLHGLQGQLLLNRGNAKDAVFHLQESVRFEPRDPQMWSSLAMAQRANGELAQALLSVQKGIKFIESHQATLKDKKLAPQQEKLLASLIVQQGVIFQEQGDPSEAKLSYDWALDVIPDFAEALMQMGTLHQQSGRMDHASELYRRAIQQHPKLINAHHNLGVVSAMQGLIADAIDSYRQAASLSITTEAKENIQCKIQALKQQICDWENFDANLEKVKKTLHSQINSDSSKPLCLSPLDALRFPIDTNMQLQITKHASDRMSRIARTSSSHSPQVWNTQQIQNLIKDQSYINIGYVSSNIGTYMMSELLHSVITGHNDKKFKVFVYALNDDADDEMWQTIENGVHSLTDMSTMNLDQSFDAIKRDNIHILININGYTHGHRNQLFALRPAPLQIQLSGFFSSMGAPTFFDHLISDPIASPAHLVDTINSEKIAYLPVSFAVSDYATDQASSLEIDVENLRQEHGLPGSHIPLLASFNSPYKITPSLFAAWMDILKQVPTAKLWIHVPGQDAMLDSVRENLQISAVDSGVDSSRLIFTGMIDRGDHNAIKRAAHLVLDSNLYNAHTTGLEILNAGVPILTCCSQNKTHVTMSQRVGQSMLTSLGVDDKLVATDLADYTAKAVNLINDLDQLDSLSEKIANQRSTSKLFNSAKWMVDYERALSLALEAKASGENKMHVIV